MKRGNSILAEQCPEMRSFLSRPIHLPLMHPQILRKSRNYWHITYFQAHGIGLCHPSHFSPIGGSYARDDAVGVGLSPWRTGLARTLLLWDYTDWNPGKRETSAVAPADLLRRQPGSAARRADIRPEAPRQPRPRLEALLEPYREHFQKTFGPVRYQADSRWIATDYLNHSQAGDLADEPVRIPRRAPAHRHGGRREGVLRH